MLDLAVKSALAVERERGKVVRIGWGARLLARQGSDGRWAKGKGSDSGLYSPKWISTTYSLLQLRDFGLPASNRGAQEACKILLDRGLRKDGGIGLDAWAFWTDRGELCVTGMVLSLLAYFRLDDDRLAGIAAHLLENQMKDGGWNCRKPSGATHSSMNTTISVLEGLRHYELAGGPRLPEVRRAQKRGREFLLAHRLFRSHRTGKIIKSAFLKFAFPPRWHYDVLRALDYFRASGAPRDERLAEAIDLVRKARGEDGRWPLQRVYPGKTYFEIERVGAPSRRNTLRAMRVLKWWEGK